MKPVIAGGFGLNIPGISIGAGAVTGLLDEPNTSMYFDRFPTNRHLIKNSFNTFSQCKLHPNLDFSVKVGLGSTEVDLEAKLENDITNKKNW